jgi:hypothetical protein
MSKYHAQKAFYKGERYDSKRECEYAIELDWLIQGGIVEKWERQIPFLLTVNGQKIGKYILDFKVYYKDGHIEYIDVKGMRTPLYKWKKKHLEAEHKIPLKEVY